MDKMYRPKRDGLKTPTKKPAKKPIVKPTNQSTAAMLAKLPAGFSKPTAKPILSIKAKKQIAAKEPKPTMQQMLKKK
jgi:hypothetical protein